jgi:beta-glucanase (GH16 family)
MRTLLPILAVLLLAPVLAADTAGDRWELVWSDEFDHPGAPDPEKWDYEVGKVRNGEAQYYTKDRRENARVEDGQLVIEARKEDFEKSGYTSASLRTKGKASWTYGRVAVRAKLPQGRGVWPAIWMLGDNVEKAGWPRCGEIDIMEFVGHTPQTVYGTVHTEAFNHTKGTQKGKSFHLEDPHGAWHVYAIEWTPHAIDFLVDDETYFTVEDDGKGEADWPFTKPQYLLINLAIGGGWGGQKGIDDAIFPQELRVDWVRIYRDKHAADGAAPAAPAKP